MESKKKTKTKNKKTKKTAMLDRLPLTTWKVFHKSVKNIFTAVFVF